MVRIRKRSLAAAANSSAKQKQELHESSNGELHFNYAGPKSNHSFLQDPKSSTALLSSPSIIIEDHLMLTGSGKGFTHDQRPTHKQIPAKGGAVKRSTVASTCGSRQARKNDKGLLAMMKGGNYVQDYEVKHMHMQDAGDGKAKVMDIKSSMVATGLAETISTVYPGRGDEAETRKKERHGESITFSDPAIADAIDFYPRKVLPLHMILTSSESHVTAARVPAHNVNNNNINDNDTTRRYLTSSGSTVQSAPSTPLKVPGERDAAEEKKASATARKSRAVLSASAAGGSSKNDVDSEFAGMRNHEDMKLRRGEVDANRCSQNTSSTHKSLERSLVSSWQGHRRPRSFSHAASGGRPSVNAEVRKSSLLIEQGNQLIVNPTPQYTSSDSAASSAVILGNAKLRQQQDSCRATMNTAINVKKKDHESLPSAPAPCPQLPKLEVGSNNRKRAAAPTDGHDLEMTVNVVPVNHVASPSSSAHDHDFMRCRRKDGRRWRCKERVIKPGAPFCHYHTLKMREKHSTRVVIGLSKQRQDEGPEMTNDTEVISKSGRKRASKRRRIRSSPYNNNNMEDRYGARILQNQEEVAEEEEQEEEDVAAINKLGKQQGKVLQEAGSSTAVKRRWRKKCKPCIRRLHDIQDRVRPAATNDLDVRSSFWEDSTTIAGNYMQDSARPDIRVSCPLPVCLLNTDPHEWRSD